MINHRETARRNSRFNNRKILTELYVMMERMTEILSKALSIHFIIQKLNFPRTLKKPRPLRLWMIDNKPK